MSYEKTTFNKTCKQLTHFPPCDFDSVLCAVLRVARQEVCRKKIWAFWYLQNPFSTIKRPYQGLQKR
jgi:hypothetical protein